MQTVRQKRKLVHRTSVQSVVLRSVGCWLIGEPDETLGQILLSYRLERKTAWAASCMHKMHQNAQLVDDPLLYGQPVKLLQSWSHVITQTDPVINLTAAF